MLTLDKVILVVLLLSLGVLADSPFYVSKKQGLLVRQPPGWKVSDADDLVLSDPSSSARVRFSVVAGKDAVAVWENAASRLGKSRTGFLVVEELVKSPRACLVQARFQEGGNEWIGTYTVKPQGTLWLVSSSESRRGIDAKLANWLTSVLESATSTRK